MEKKHTHLQFIQNVINRLSYNSFLLKGWTVVLVSALFALASKDVTQHFIYVAFLPALIFWGLDGFFLSTEWKYRKLYDYIRTLSEEEIYYSMNPGIADSSLNNKGKSFKMLLKAIFSKTLIPFYGIVLIAILIAMCNI